MGLPSHRLGLLGDPTQGIAGVLNRQEVGGPEGFPVAGEFRKGIAGTRVGDGVQSGTGEHAVLRIAA